MIALIILKIIGFSLLSLLGTIVLFILLVLFWPISYRLSGYRKADMEPVARLEVRLSWLLRLLRLSYIRPGQAYIKVKLLFFTIYRSDRPAKKRADDKPRKRGIKSADNQGRTAEAAATVPKQEKNIGENYQEKRKEAGQKDRKVHKIFARFRNIVYTIRRTYDRIKEGFADISGFFKRLVEYVSILNSNEFRLAATLCATQLKKIWKNTRPRKIRAAIQVGTSDPRTTGQILELYSVLYPFIGPHVAIYPDFDRPMLNGDVYIRGRITLFVLLWAAWTVYKDDNIRAVQKLLSSARQ